MRNHIIVGGAIIAAIIIGGLSFLYGGGKISNASPSAVENHPAVTPVAVSFTKIAEGTQPTISTRTNYLITSADQLNKLWKMIDATSTPPEVDFGTDSVIAVFAGSESASSAIAVANVEDSNARTVSITLSESSGDCTSKLSSTTPYEIVSLLATTLPLAHQDTVATTSCSQ